MEDFLGSELSIGDRIVVATRHGRDAGASLVEGVVTRFTPKMVFYTGKEAYYSDTIREKKTYPEKIIKVITPDDIRKAYLEGQVRGRNCC